MGYVGFEQIICISGHLSEIDAYKYKDDTKCPICVADICWSNSVDQTNNDGSSYTNFVELSPARIETCDKCEYVKVIERAIYLAPTDKEMEQYYKEREEQAMRVATAYYTEENNFGRDDKHDTVSGDSKRIYTIKELAKMYPIKHHTTIETLKADNKRLQQLLDDVRDDIQDTLETLIGRAVKPIDI